MEKLFDVVKFDEKGLVPAVVQDYMTGEVLMVAYMNKETLKMTIDTGYATFWSRSRSEVWVKGNTSGNKQEVKEITVDCDGDALLVKVNQIGGKACHTGERSCFFRKVDGENVVRIDTFDKRDFFAACSCIKEDFDTIIDRKNNPKEGSYTNYLFEKGIDKILKKVGEESAEVIIAAKNRVYDEVKLEVADLIYHLTVMLAEQDMSWEDVFIDIRARQK